MKEVFFLYRPDILCGSCKRYLNPKNYDSHTSGPKCIERYRRRIKKELWYKTRKKYLNKIYNDKTTAQYISN